MDNKQEALAFHKDLQGKIEVVSRASLDDKRNLQLAYTPGVAQPCLEIAQDVSKVYDYTRKGNMVAVITDGTAVLGLGDIGPEAGLPVMEGKAMLFKEFAGIDAFPIALKTKDVDEIVRTVSLLSPMFGGINLEDISAPRCFEIEQRLQDELDIPVFHDDQHGTAIVTAAGLVNALKVVEKAIEDVRVVISGVGAAGVAITNLLIAMGVQDVVLTDSQGAICDERENLNSVKQSMLEKTNQKNMCGTLADALRDADVFIGVSVGGLVTADMVKTMAEHPVIIAMANPDPEILPEEALAAGAAVVATGRSDFPNQLNNVLVFPGVFRGLLDARLSTVTMDMKKAAAYALADLIENPTAEKIIPDVFDERVVPAIAKAIQQAA